MMINEKERQIRSEFIAVARELIKKYGFTKTNMEDIAKQAHKSKTTLYQYFRNKDEVIKAITEEEMREVYSTVLRETNKEETAVGQLKAYFKTMLTEVKNRAVLYALLRGELTSVLFNSFTIKQEIDLVEIEQVKSILRNGIILGEFSPQLMDSIDAIAYYIVNGSRGVLMQLVLYSEFDKTELSEENTDKMMEILIRGLSR